MPEFSKKSVIIARGFEIDALHTRLADAISRRTLQRRLAQFVAEGKLATR